jgi:hypothetical protein
LGICCGCGDEREREAEEQLKAQLQAEFESLRDVQRRLMNESNRRAGLQRAGLQQERDVIAQQLENNRQNRIAAEQQASQREEARQREELRLRLEAKYQADQESIQREAERRRQRELSLRPVLEFRKAADPAPQSAVAKTSLKSRQGQQAINLPADTRGSTRSMLENRERLTDLRGSTSDQELYNVLDNVIKLPPSIQQANVGGLPLIEQFRRNWENGNFEKGVEIANEGLRLRQEEFLKENPDVSL